MNGAARPGYWMNETTGALRPAIIALIDGEDLTPDQIELVRAYLRQWIFAPGFLGEEVEKLRASVEFLVTRQSIENWISYAIDAGCDPL